MKTCTIDGCEKPLRAKGMCSTHYNRKHQPNRHLDKTRPCAWCGVPVAGSGGGGRKMGAACSTACRGHLLALAMRGGAKSDSTTVVHQPRGKVKPLTDARPRPERQARARWFAGTCRVCSRAYVAPLPGVTCSPECTDTWARASRHEHKHRRRARERTAYVAPVNRYAIYNRDDWTCWLCHMPIDRSADAQADMAPSLDHVIPLANGGTHEPANVATAHRLCNARRSNTPTITSRTGERVAVLF